MDLNGSETDGAPAPIYLHPQGGMTVYLRLLVECAEEALASHASLVDRLQRTTRGDFVGDADTLRAA